MYNPLYTPKRERNLFGGFNPYASIQPFADLAYGILGWFSVTVEAFLRRDFGERYFSKMNFLAGFLMLSFITFWGAIFTASSFSWIMLLVLMAYLILSMMHFFKIMARNLTGKPLHSLDAGTSRVELLAKLILVILNPIVELLVKAVGAFLLNQEQQERVAESMPIFKDTRAITERVLEPLLLFMLHKIAIAFDLNVEAFWLLFSGLALVIHTNYAYEAERMQLLDHQDQILEAVEMQRALTGGSPRMRVKSGVRQTLKHIAVEVESNPQTMQEIEAQSPSLADAMAALNPKLRKVATEAEQ